MSFYDILFLLNTRQNVVEWRFMTLLYYSVKESIRTLQNAYYPADLFSASIVTFTDGEDDGSVYYEKYPGDDEAYLQDVNTLLNTEEVAGVPLSAWTIGLQSADASDS